MTPAARRRRSSGAIRPRFRCDAIALRGSLPRGSPAGRAVRLSHPTARDAVRFLLSMGHRKIAYFSGNLEYHDTRERLRGIDAALGEVGMTRGDIYLDCGTYTEDFGQAAALRLLETGREFTAIFAGDDDIAAGVLLAVRQRGLQVPQDISIMGFDDNFHARHLTPTLTTIRQPIGLAGEKAADLLLSIIAGKTPRETDILIPTDLLIRDSVRDISAGR